MHHIFSPQKSSTFKCPKQSKILGFYIWNRIIRARFFLNLLEIHKGFFIDISPYSYPNLSNKLNAKATVNMLTFRCMFRHENETKTIGIHIFQQIKDPYSAWVTGRNLILEILQDLGLEIDRVVRVSFAFLFDF